MNQDFQQQRLAQLMAQQPQYSGTAYDGVVATVDFKLSTHSNPKKAQQNIKRAVKALKPLKRPLFSLATAGQRDISASWTAQTVSMPTTVTC